MFSVNEDNAVLEVLSAANGNPIAQARLGEVPPFDGPALAPGRVLVSAGTRIKAFDLNARRDASGRRARRRPRAP